MVTPTEIPMVRKEFQIPEKDVPKTEELIKYAFLSSHIKKDSWQDFMLFAINCAYTYLKAHEIKVRKGLG